ncbi:MAG TPA: LLM class flavin-dependent oxidoreductase [Candidatus Limnocylindrales bacterium]|nr:LLM class flavin-dependent oxidoreductase [Candidatus Limnocylindrales bacterium]
MLEFGLILAAPSAHDEPMTDRLDWYRALLRAGNGAYGSGWLPDHLMKHDGPMLEAWTTLTFLAAEFPSYSFGHTVLCQSYRNPALLAKMAATLDYLTRGRFVMGIGAGWQADEYRAYNYPFPSAGTRIAQLAETIDILRALWTQSPATYEGEHYQVRDAYCVPQPSKPIPILVGGRRPKFMRVAAEKADIWQWDGPIERYRPPYDLLAANCAELGRDLASVRLSTSGEVYLPTDAADFPRAPSSSFMDPAQDPAGAYAGEEDWVLGPTPDDAVRGLMPLVELGVTHFTMFFWDRASMQRFADEVIPRLR